MSERVQCGACRHFQHDGQSAERALPGLASLSSGHGASRTGDGLCLHHDRLLRASASCGVFAPRGHGVEALAGGVKA